MRVLVTGGAGFIGSHLIRELVSKDWSVAVLDDFSSGKKENIDRNARHNLNIIRGDIRDRNIVDEAVTDVEAVVHLAGFVDPAESVKRPIFTNDVNVNGTLNVLDSSAKNSVKKFVFASSAGVYGDGNPLPIREEYDLKPASPYAASKVAGEYYCKIFCHCYGLGSVILRFFNVYGPGQGSNAYAGVITRFLRTGLRGEPLMVYGDGNQTRDFINVKDVVSAIVKALEHKSSKTDVFNVCTGISLRIDDLADMVSQVLGKKLQISHGTPRIGDIVNSYGYPGKAERTLGFRANIKLREGLEQLVQNTP